MPGAPPLNGALTSERVVEVAAQEQRHPLDMQHMRAQAAQVNTHQLQALTLLMQVVVADIILMPQVMLVVA